jgi:hypothetical protein
MLDRELLGSIARQMMSATAVDLNGKKIPVRRTSSHRLRVVGFEIDGQACEAIEQNPEKPSRWGQLARDGHQVVQFKDAATNRFVAVAVDGKVKLYGSRSGSKKPDHPTEPDHSE